MRSTAVAFSASQDTTPTIKYPQLTSEKKIIIISETLSFFLLTIHHYAFSQPACSSQQKQR